MTSKNIPSKKVILTILDGWGLAEKGPYNSIDQADTPIYDRLIRNYPNTSLYSHGEHVGLPSEQTGTSEVNHLTIGAGRIVRQELPKINHAIETGEFRTNKAILEAIDHAIKHSSRLHITGILSDGGVHSHINHLFALFDMLSNIGFQLPIYIHAYTDGRDTTAISAERYLKQLDSKIAKLSNLNINLATLQGRIFLDRDRNWTRTEESISTLIGKDGTIVSSWKNALEYAYNTADTDQTVPRYILNKSGGFKENDSLIIFNYRTDRIYQLISRILEIDFKNFCVCSFVSPSDDFDRLRVAFPKSKVENTLAETISKAGLSQYHLTETEKYPHVTYFLNGEREHELPRETWELLQSNRYVDSRYQLDPNMQNFEIAKRLETTIARDQFDFIVSNICSPDMVGHTGNLAGAIVSANSVDYCLGKIWQSLEPKIDKYYWIITADHGNSEIMWDEEAAQPHTRHTHSKVPFILVSNEQFTLGRERGLEEVAPTILELMGLTKPIEMTGESLILH